MTTITRIGFCPECAKHRRPETGSIFLAFGTTHQKFKVLIAGSCQHHPYGYVPHTYQLVKIIGNGDVIVEKSCSMYECGVDAEYIKEQNSNFFFIKSWKREVWTLATWNALVELKHNCFTQNYEL